MTRSVRGAHEDLFFRQTVADFVEQPRFLRRQWLAEEVDRRLQEPGCRFVVLTAEPGFGKSVFMAQLAHDHEEWPRYFIRRDQRAPLASAGARSFLLRIGLQLADLHPRLFDIDPVTADVEEEIETVYRSGETIGIRIGELVSSPFFQQVHYKVSQKVKEVHGTLVGIDIGQLTTDPLLLDVSELQKMALFDPADRLQQTEPDSQIVILIDAVDELRFHYETEDILHWLTSHTGELPDNLRIIIASRPPDLRLQHFMREYSPLHEPKDLREWKSSSPPVEWIALEAMMSTGTDREPQPEHAKKVKQHIDKDVLTYAETLAEQPALEPYWALVADTSSEGERGESNHSTVHTRERFVTEVAGRADRNLGYLNAIARAIDAYLDAIAGGSDNSKREEYKSAIVSLLSFKALPRGLTELHAHLLRQIRLMVVRERDTAGDWLGILLPILGTLTVAEEPLTKQQIKFLAGVKASLATVADNVDKIMHFLDPIEDRYRLYHGSLNEFLTSSETARDYSEFYCDALESHETIGDQYFEHFQGNWSQCDGYGLRYLPYHLAGAERHTELGRLLLDLKFLQAKVDKGDIRDLINDFDFLAVEDSQSPAWLVQHALELSAHVLATDKTQLTGQLLGRLRSHESPKIQKLLDQAREWRGATWFVPETQSLLSPGSGLLSTVPIGHVGGLRALSREMIIVAQANPDCTFSFWDQDTGKRVRAISVEAETVSGAAIAPGGKFGVVRVHSATSRELALWVIDLETGAIIQTLTGLMEDADNRVNMTLASDSSKVVVAEGNRRNFQTESSKIRIWNVAEGIELPSLHTFPGHLRSLGTFADGKCAWFVSQDHTIEFWDLERANVTFRISEPDAIFRAMTLTLDGRYAITLFNVRFDDDTVPQLSVWDLEKRKRVRTVTCQDLDIGSEFLAVTPDGKKAAVMSNYGPTYGKLQTWDLEQGIQLHSLPGPSEHVYAMDITSDSKHVIAAVGDGTLKAWDISGESVGRIERGHSEAVTGVVILPGKRKALSASLDGCVKVWDLDTGKSRTLLECASGVIAADATSDGQYAVLATRKKTLVLELESELVIREIRVSRDVNQAMTILPSRESIFSAEDRVLPRIIDLDTGQKHPPPYGRVTEINRLTGRHPPKYARAIIALAATEDGRRAVSVADGGRIALWYLDQRTYPKVLGRHQHGGGAQAVAVTGDGQWAVSSSKEIVVWDLDKSSELRRFDDVHDGPITGIVLVSNDRLVISCAKDATVRLWNLETGRVLATFTGDSAFKACAVSSDGLTVVAGDQSGQIHFLRLVMVEQNQ